MVESTKGAKVEIAGERFKSSLVSTRTTFLAMTFAGRFENSKARLVCEPKVRIEAKPLGIVNILHGFDRAARYFQCG